LFRPGTISGHSLSGASNQHDFYIKFIAGILQLGYYPKVDCPMDMAPVDYTAKAIGNRLSTEFNYYSVMLGSDHNNTGKTYHITSPHEPVTVQTLITAILQKSPNQKRPSYVMEGLDYPTWRTKLFRTIEKNVQSEMKEANALEPLLPYFSGEFPVSSAKCPKVRLLHATLIY
jgi:thioester reductase-like protein